MTYTKSAVTRNYSEKTINGILDYVGGGKGGPVEVDVLEQFYQATKDALIEAKNEVCTWKSIHLQRITDVSTTETLGENELEAGKTLARSERIWPVNKGK